MVDYQCVNINACGEKQQAFVVNVLKYNVIGVDGILVLHGKYHKGTWSYTGGKFVLVP